MGRLLWMRVSCVSRQNQVSAGSSFCTLVSFLHHKLCVLGLRLDQALDVLATKAGDF